MAKKKTAYKPGDHVVTNADYLEVVGCEHEGTLRRPQQWRERLWSVSLHHPVLSKSELMHERMFEKWSDKHMGQVTSEKVKLAGFTWLKTDRNQWVTDKVPNGDTTVARIKFLDAKTWPVYRNGKYLGSEPTMEAAAERAKTNKISERNKAKYEPPARPDLEAKKVRAKVQAEVAAKKKTEPRAGKTGERNTEILTLLGRGCTREEVLRVTGWKAVSMQQMARGLGVGLRVDKEARPVKYFSTKE